MKESTRSRATGLGLEEVAPGKLKLEMKQLSQDAFLAAVRTTRSTVPSAARAYDSEPDDGRWRRKATMIIMTGRPGARTGLMDTVAAMVGQREMRFLQGPSEPLPNWLKMRRG